MKSSIFASIALFLVILNTESLHAQGTFVYDQQSVTSDSAGGEGAPIIQASQPVGQSFTPTLSSVGFIRLFLSDSTLNGLGATVFIYLRSDSITGPILGSTDPVFMPDGFVGRTNFSFQTEVSVSPGTTYFFQPIVQSGDNWRIVDDPNYNYPGGTAYGGGQPAPPFDLWFREGIIIPEPASISLILVGSGIMVWLRSRSRKRPTNLLKGSNDAIVDGVRSVPD